MEKVKAVLVWALFLIGLILISPWLLKFITIYFDWVLK